MEINKTQVYRLNRRQLRYLPIKRSIDLFMSVGAVIVLAPLLISICVAIKLDSPGPIFFKQKRVGKNKGLFDIYKFRTMRIDTPKDMPTHMLSEPEQYITRVGKVLRKTSLDELPQLYNIIKGDMSIIAPRPSLWNQNDLILERDKYGVHQIAPGLTGWAQINGRDELEIPLKAKFDGEYIENMGFLMDVKCFLGTIGSVLSHDGVVEGGTGELHKVEQPGNVISAKKVKNNIAIGGGIFCLGIFGFVAVIMGIVKHCKRTGKERKEKTSTKGKITIIFSILLLFEAVAIVYTNIKRKIQLKDTLIDLDEVSMNMKDDVMLYKPKRVLITGANSYIGMAVEARLNREGTLYQVDTLDLLDENWINTDFSSYQVVFHVAGIAHTDVGSVTEEERQLYYRVNRDLTVKVAKKAKAEGVEQFIFMSSMIVYSGCKEKIITNATVPKPLNFYGDSKWQADQKVRELSSNNFKVVVLRPPMIYGKGSKGNYPILAKLAIRLRFFPVVDNRRSMLHIDNLCEFVKLMIDNEEEGIFFPQNKEYTNTSDMVQMIAEVKRHNIIMIPCVSWVIRIMQHIPGKIGQLTIKAFGDSVYEMNMSEYKQEYRVNSLRKSIELTEE